MLVKKLADLKKRAITAFVGISSLLVYKYFIHDWRGEYNATGDDFFIGILFLVLYSEMLIACYISTTSLLKRICVFIFKWIYLVVGLISMSFVFSSDFFLSFFASVFFVDTSAYLVGNLFKGPKLCPSISPNKTVSGFIGASIIGTIMFELMMASEVCAGCSIFLSLVVGFVFVLSVQLGDLLVSFVKRILQIKDFSNLLPGHGGVWDRFDSIFAGAIMLVIWDIVKVWIGITGIN